MNPPSGRSTRMTPRKRPVSPRSVAVSRLSEPESGVKVTGAVKLLRLGARRDAVLAVHPGDGRGDAGSDVEAHPRHRGVVGLGAGQLHGADAAAQPHADGIVVHRAEGDAGVVVLEDRLVLPAVLGVAVGAPLRHADAVAPAAAGDREHGGGGAGLRRPPRRAAGQAQRGRRRAPACPGALRRARRAGVMGAVGSEAVIMGSGHRIPPGRIRPPRNEGQTVADDVKAVQPASAIGRRSPFLEHRLNWQRLLGRRVAHAKEARAVQRV